jgi:hypothetical protein
MAEQKPNDPSSKSKAEGERWSDDGREQFDQSDATPSGVSNRPPDEEITNQESVPPRGKPQSRRDEFAREGLETPRRYEQPIEDDDDPVMPSDDATVNTKI